MDFFNGLVGADGGPLKDSGWELILFRKNQEASVLIFEQLGRHFELFAMQLDQFDGSLFVHITLITLV